MKILLELDLFTQGDKLMKLAVKFTLTSEERHQFCNFIKLVKFLDGFTSNSRKNITNDDKKISNMKSYNCDVIIQT